MAELRNKNNNNNLELSLSSSSVTATTSSSSRFPFLNRSLTTKPSQKAHHLDRAGSLTKFHNSVESAGNSIRGRVVKKLCNFFEPKPASSSSSSSSESLPNNKLKTSKSIENSKEALLKAAATTTAIGYLDSSDHIRLPGAEDRIVLYFTSLRGIRRTYEDCYAVRMIFRGFRVWVDERDISMDSAYKKELTSVLGEKNKNKNNNVTLPQVFIRGRYVGGSDVIKHLCEVGELGKILEGFPRTKPGFVCESCGDVRFAPCGNCSGSRKVFDEDEGLLKRCLECNENGLIRCPNCCS